MNRKQFLPKTKTGETDEAGCGGYHWRSHQPSHVTKIFLKKGQHRTAKSRPVLSRPIQVYSRVGRRVGRTISRKIDTPEKC